MQKMLFIEPQYTLVVPTGNKHKPYKPPSKHLPLKLKQIVEAGVKITLVTAQATTPSKLIDQLKSAGYRDFSIFDSVQIVRPITKREFFERAAHNGVVFKSASYEQRVDRARDSGYLSEEAFGKAIRIAEIMRREGIERRDALMIGSRLKEDAAAARLLQIPHGWANKDFKLTNIPPKFGLGAGARDAVLAERKFKKTAQNLREKDLRAQIAEKARRRVPQKSKYKSFPRAKRKYDWLEQKAVARFLRGTQQGVLPMLKPKQNRLMRRK